MKRLLLFVFLFILMAQAFPLQAQRSYRIVARVAEKHLRTDAKEAVRKLLGNESMADAASWAVGAIKENEYKKKSSWNFLYVQAGLMNEGEFDFVVKAQKKPNLYSAILGQEQIMKDTTNTKAQKITALKWLIILVADAHQPAHIITPPAKRKKQELSLQDSLLIDKNGQSDSVLAELIDKATPDHVKQFQIEDPLRWLWESYRIKTKLNGTEYGQADEDYYKKYAGNNSNRLELAGLRLAAVLRRLFPVKYKGPGSYRMIIDTVAYVASPYFGETDIKDVAGYVKKFVRITARVYGHKKTGDSVLVYMGAKQPNQLLTVVLKGVSTQFKKHINGKSVSIFGTVVLNNGKPQIRVIDPAQISFVALKNKSK